MSKLKQRYLKEVKSFFPIMGKPDCLVVTDCFTASNTFKSIPP